MTLSRRRFLSSATALACAPIAAARASDPINRTGKPYFKLSLAAYSFNRFLPKNWPKPSKSQPTMSIENFVDFCAAMDLDGTELTSYYFPVELTPAYLASLKERAFRLGLDISGTAIGNDFCLADGPAREFELGMTRKWIDYAAMLGAPVIRIFAGDTPKGDTEAAALQRCIAGIETSLEYAAEKGVALAIENHGGITSTAEQLLRIVKAVKPSPWFGVNFDSGNFHSSDPYAEMELIAPYALNAQVKVSITPAGGKKEPADLERVVGILKSAGYRGYLVLEYEEDADPREAVPITLKTLKSLIGRG
jgi:sugar phosphate isomerase/epimerase